MTTNFKIENAKAFYAVYKGYQKGIYLTWDECKKNVDGYPKPIYKKFTNMNDAESFMEHGDLSVTSISNSSSIKAKVKSKPSILDFIETEHTSMSDTKSNIEKEKEKEKEKEPYENYDQNHNHNNKSIKIKKDESQEQLINPNYFQKEYVYIFCDGSSIQDNNYKSIRCGYGVYIVKQNGESISIPTLIDRSVEGTNNIAELSAILCGLKIVKKYKLRKVIFISDSVYAINCITVWSKNWKKNNWQTSKKTPIENVEIIQEAVELYDFLKSQEYDLIFKHINSHMKQPDEIDSYEYFLWYGNDMTDQLARYGEITKKYKKPEVKLEW